MRIFTDPEQKALYDQARDRVLKDGKPVLTAAKEFQLPVTSLWHYVRQLDWNYRYRKHRTKYHRPKQESKPLAAATSTVTNLVVEQHIMPSPPVIQMPVIMDLNASNPTPWARKGVCNSAVTKREKKRARNTAKTFSSSGIIYDNERHTTVCTWCNCFVNWTKVSDVKRHIETRKHLQDRFKFDPGASSSSLNQAVITEDYDQEYEIENERDDEDNDGQEQEVEEIQITPWEDTDLATLQWETGIFYKYFILRN